MIQIQNHVLRKRDEETTIILYLDPSLEEFADELGLKSGGEKNDLTNSVQKYVKGRFPNLKKATVKVMVGSMLVSAFAFSPSLGLVPIDKAAAAETVDDDNTQGDNDGIIDVSDTTIEDFTDVDDEHEFYKFIKDFTDRNVVKGYEDEGLFKIYDNMTRAQAAKVIANVMGLDVEPANGTDFEFQDVPEEGSGNSWAYGYVSALAEEGVI